MTDRQIIFSAAMVRALLEGRKSQTRRVLSRSWPVLGTSWRGKSYDAAWDGLRLEEGVDHNGRDPHIAVPWCHHEDQPMPSDECGIYRVRPPYAIGDRLWVREAYCGHLGPIRDDMPREPRIAYDCEDERVLCFYQADDATKPWPWSKWRSSIHMPRWASRLTLHVTDVRVQRLQEISEEDSLAEGCGLPFLRDLKVPKFRDLWNSLHGPDAWDQNPWVCAVSFTVEHCNIDASAQDRE